MLAFENKPVFGLPFFGIAKTNSGNAKTWNHHPDFKEKPSLKIVIQGPISVVPKNNHSHKTGQILRLLTQMVNFVNEVNHVCGYKPKI